MLQRPGKWAVMLPDGLSYYMVDVEADGTCHQLKPDEVTRDGVLRPEGWIGNERVYQKTGDTMVRIWMV